MRRVAKDGRGSELAGRKRDKIEVDNQGKERNEKVTYNFDNPDEELICS